MQSSESRLRRMTKMGKRLYVSPVSRGYQGLDLYLREPHGERYLEALN